ncbi:anthranilate synthase component I [Serpentinicella sp. ANB-PHB4]|uniref:anthranilate synthase component I n=1 Tax=Serpentinicella sp. ANB-PHB4 TaxID=3074076 RepID=UPI00285E2CE9|nr:anthranilate synthase component I [Serpentinicella sp. ANB-PHB4]MDR5659153.1 anthranilate synthase component I [Serpentinicella sp. ANB-PHB4]
MNMVPYVKTLSGDKETPITLYEKYVGKSVGFLLESKDPAKGRFSFIAKNPFITLQGLDESLLITSDNESKTLYGNSFALAQKYIEQYQVSNNTNIPFVGGAVGTIGYDVIRQHENLPNVNQDTLGLPDLHLMLVKEVVVYDHFHSQIHLVVLDDSTNEGKDRGFNAIQLMEKQLFQFADTKISSVNESTKSPTIMNEHTTKEDFIEKVNQAKAYIREGDIFQVVLSQRWSLENKKDAFTLYRQLREINPSPYLFYFNFGTYQIAGSSPEMLVEVRNEKVFTCPIAGTRKKGKSPAEDHQLAKDLLADPKEKAEHIMLVDLARNDMGRVSKIGTVHVEEFMQVHHYAHVMHIVSTVEGIKNEDENQFSILSHFLPAGTLSGAPKIRAMEIIDELEKEKRGLYGGAVGYFGFDGNLDTCIAIRTMVIKDQRVYLQAGAGIVADSVPESEYEECKNKIQSLVRALEY